MSEFADNIARAKANSEEFAVALENVQAAQRAINEMTADELVLLRQVREANADVDKQKRAIATQQKKALDERQKAEEKVLAFIEKKEKEQAAARKERNEKARAQLAQIGQAANVIATLGASGGLFAKGAQDTVQMERLKIALERLAFVVASELAPYIEGLTQVVQHLTRAYTALEPGIKKTIAAIAVGLTVFGAILAIIPLIITVVSGLAAAFAFLLSPVGLVIAGVGLLVGALIYMMGPLGDLEEAFGSVGGFIMKTWQRVIGVLQAGAAVIVTALMNTVKAMENIINGRDILKGIEDPIVKARVILEESERKAVKAETDGKEFGKGLAQKIITLKAELAKFTSGVSDAWQKGFEKGGPAMKRFNVGFETGQGSFDRLQTAFASDPLQDASLVEAKKQTGLMQEQLAATQKVAENVNPVK